MKEKLSRSDYLKQWNTNKAASLTPEQLEIKRQKNKDYLANYYLKSKVKVETEEDDEPTQEEKERMLKDAIELIGDDETKLPLSLVIEKYNIPIIPISNRRGTTRL